MSQETQNFHHISVLSEELISGLNLKPGDWAIDCTTGGGGHSKQILEKILPDGKLLALDQDPDAIKHLKQKFAQEIEAGSVILEQASFSQLGEIAKKHGFLEKASGIMADIGVSSHQLDIGERGFSFMQDGPLNMRMDGDTEALTAEKLLNTFSAEEIADIIYKYGEERFSRRIAKAIVDQREKAPLTRTLELGELVKSATPYKNSKKHPATKTFQALRIYLNEELEELETLLKSFCPVLKPSGRLGMITFHSLEDRIVKQNLLELSGRNKQKELPREIPLTASEMTSYNEARVKIIKPFPTKPSNEELKVNPRARSAKLRVVEKL